MSDNPDMPVEETTEPVNSFNDNPLLVLLVIVIAVGSAALFDTTFAIVVAVAGALFFLAMGERRRAKRKGTAESRLEEKGY